MTITMYKSSAPIFVQFLTSLSGVLDKAQTFSDARKLDQATLLGLRTYPDMFPLSRQVEQVCTHAVRCMARLAGQEPAAYEGTDTTIADLKKRIAWAIEQVKSHKAGAIDGSEDREIVFKMARGEMKFTGQQFLLNFTLPNFYFHATTAYNILRNIGVELGKRDFMGTPPQM